MEVSSSLTTPRFQILWRSACSQWPQRGNGLCDYPGSNTGKSPHNTLTIPDLYFQPLAEAISIVSLIGLFCDPHHPAAVPFRSGLEPWASVYDARAAGDSCKGGPNPQHGRRVPGIEHLRRLIYRWTAREHRLSSGTQRAIKAPQSARGSVGYQDWCVF